MQRSAFLDYGMHVAQELMDIHEKLRNWAQLESLSLFNVTGEFGRLLFLLWLVKHCSRAFCGWLE